MAIPFTPTAAAKVAPTTPVASSSGAIPFTPGQPVQAQPVAPVASTPVPVQPGHPNIGLTTNSPTGLAAVGANLKALPGQLLNAGKGLFNAVTSGEQAVSGEIASGLPASITGENQLNQANQSNASSDVAFIKAINAQKTSGKPITPTQQQLYDHILQTNSSVGKQTDLLPNAADTNSQALGNVAQVGADVLGFGSYGAASSGAKFLPEAGNLLGKSGQLTAKTAIPSVVTAAKTAVNVTANAAKTAANAVPSLVKPALLGKEGISTLAKIANPEAKAFVPVAQGGAGKTFSTVVDGTQKAINSFVSTSKAALQAVKQQIPTGIKIGTDKIASVVNDGILKSVQSNAEYHGINGEVSSIFKTPQSLINSGLLNTEEAARVKGMVNVVKNWSDNSARGVLTLKEQLAPFYKDGLNGSNHILCNIQTGLNNLVADVHPAIKPALEAASANIDKADQFTRHLVGSNPTTGETKLITLAKNLNNPALKGYQHSLLSDLSKATGHNVEPQLKGYADYLDLLAKDFPGKFKTTLKAVATGPAAKTVGAIAGTGIALQGAKDLGL